jgi:hypothetical protein
LETKSKDDTVNVADILAAVSTICTDEKSCSHQLRQVRKCAFPSVTLQRKRSPEDWSKKASVYVGLKKRNDSANTFQFLEMREYIPRDFYTILESDTLLCLGKVSGIIPSVGLRMITELNMSVNGSVQVKVKLTNCRQL